MFKNPPKQLLRHSRLTFSVARSLIQRPENWIQFSSSCQCVARQKQTAVSCRKGVLQENLSAFFECFDIRTRGFHTGRLRYSSEKVNNNVGGFMDDSHEIKDLNNDADSISENCQETENSNVKVLQIYEKDKEQTNSKRYKRKRSTDVANYLDNIVDELVDLERTASKICSPELVVPKYYKPKSIIETILEEEQDRELESSGKELVEAGVDYDKTDIAEVDESEQFMLAERGELVVEGVQKVELPAELNLDEIVNENKALQVLVKVGVDLTILQQKGMIDTVIRMHHKKELAPYVFFLRDNGVPSEQVGRLINRCPWIFQHPLHNLQVRVDYLRSKKFKIEHLSNMLDKDPKFLLVPVKQIDARLGFIQKLFNLSGAQIRAKVGGYSKLIIAPSSVLMQNKIILERELGFTKDEVKTMFLAFPKIFHRDPQMILDNFNYVHEVMGIPYQMIAKTPQVLNTMKSRLENRYRFLLKCGRVQFDPTKENYVSLMSFISLKDEEWCLKVAKSSVAEYNKFLKMI